jgi:hypothetical protein
MLAHVPAEQQGTTSARPSADVYRLTARLSLKAKTTQADSCICQQARPATQLLRHVPKVCVRRPPCRFDFFTSGDRQEALPSDMLPVQAATCRT